MPKKILACVAILIMNGAFGGSVEANEQGRVEHQVSELNAKATKALQVGLYSDGIESAQHALRLANVHLGAEHQSTLQNMGSLASLYFEQGRYAEAETLRAELLQRRLRLLGDDHRDTWESKVRLAEAYRRQARYDEAESLYWQLLRSRRQALGHEHPESINTMVELGKLYAEQGRRGDVENIMASIRKSMKPSQRRAGTNELDRPRAIHDLAHLHWNLERYRDAERLMSKAFKLHQDLLGREHLDVLHIMVHRAALSDDQGRYDKAESRYRVALRLHAKRLGESHRDTLGAMRRFGAFYSYTDRHDKAERLLVRALKLHRENLGDQHPDTTLCKGILADLYVALERYEEAEALYKEILRYRRQHLGADHPDVFVSLDDMIWLYDNQGRDHDSDLILAEAAQLLQKRREALGNGDLETLGILHKLGSRYRERERYAEAEQLLTDALQYRQDSLGRRHPDTLDSAAQVALLHENLGRNDDARRLISATLKQREKSLGLAHPDTIRTMKNLGRQYFDEGQYERARTLFVQVLQNSRNAFGSYHPDTLDAMETLARLNIVQDRHESASTLLEEMLRRRQETLGRDHPEMLNEMDALGNVYLEQGRYEDAESIVLRAIQIQLAKIAVSNQYKNDEIKYLSILFLKFGNIPGKSHATLFFILTFFPALSLLFWLSRTTLLEKAGRIIWVSALFFAPMIIVVSGINDWAAPYFLEIDNAWIASLRAFVQVAVVEEFSKLIIVIVVCWIWSLQQQPLMVIACGLAVGVSFGALENWAYAHEYGLYTPILRLVMSLPAHVVISGCAAGFLALAWKHPNDRWRYRSLAVLVPIMLHGGYDYLLFVDDRIAADLDVVAFLVAISVVAVGAAILTYLVAWQKHPNATQPAVARSNSMNHALGAACLSISVFGIVLAAIVLSDLSIASYAALRTLKGTFEFEQLVEFPTSEVLSVLLGQQSVFAKLIIRESEGAVVPLSSIELALIPVVAMIAILSCLVLFRAVWHHLTGDVRSLTYRPART